jgi:deoxycytidylate deaminase
MDYELQSELVIGLVGAVGTEQKVVCDLLGEPLGQAGYQLGIVKISRDVIPRFGAVPDTGRNQYARLAGLMDAGNAAREKTKNNGILAWGAASHISSIRPSDNEAKPLPMPKRAFVIDSLKRPEEVNELRQIYPSGFVLIGIHADENQRKRYLMEARGMDEAEALELIRRDEEEAKAPYGQRVSSTFHMADFFVRVSDHRDQLRFDLHRIVRLLFGDPFITPTFDEHAMFMAFASALRSGDMSRQVGAVVARDWQILATGANDCPQAGGGLYWPDRNPDSHKIEDIEGGRDFTRPEGDSNRSQQRKIIDKIIEEANRHGLDESKLRQVLIDSPLRDLTEYGRVVHAEMEALLCCARNGQKTIGATIYCTTFPCHNCAKHIIAAGIDRVVYVEPYRKSKALEFRIDAIWPDGAKREESTKKVEFDAFVGVGPRRFFDLFSMQLGASYDLVRKDTEGKRSSWRLQDSRLRLQLRPMTYLEHELSAATNFLTALTEITPNEVQS